MQKIKNLFNKIKNVLQKGNRKGAVFLQKRPIRSFLTLLLLLLIFIAVGSNLSKPKTQKASVPPPKPVTVFRIGSVPRIQLEAKVEKSGIFQIVAQTPGIVQRIPIQLGQHVNGGNTLVNFSTNYQGGNAAYTQLSLAQQQNKLVNDTYQDQKDLIQKQRDLANTSDSNNDQLREISSKSASETQSVLDINTEILNYLNDQLNGATGSARIAIQQQRSQLLAANNGLNSSLRQTQYSTDGSKPPAQLSDIQKDIALKQLNIQEKSLDINKAISALQVQLAGINAALMNPATPCTGTVDRIYVKIGQAVNPGTPIALISADKQSSTVVLQVPKDTAQSVSQIEKSTLHFGTITYETFPSYVSSEATDGQLYSVFYTIPDNYLSYLTNNDYITVDVPIGYVNAPKDDPFVPLDAVFQTDEETTVNVIKNGVAFNKKVTTGAVYGRYIQVFTGISDGDQIILNRNIIQGDRVKAND